MSYSKEQTFLGCGQRQMTEGSMRSNIAGFDVEGMGPLANECGWPLKVGKSMDWEFLDSPEKNAATCRSAQ